MNVIKNIYLYREEIIIKSMDFLIFFEKVTINKIIFESF